MVATWPAISGVQYDEVQLVLADQREVFQPDVGHAKTAPTSASLQAEVVFDVVFDGDDLSVFQGWWATDAKLGAEPFDGLEGVVGDRSSRYKFREEPEFRAIRGGNDSRRLWRATFRLWRMRGAATVFEPGVFEPGVFEEAVESE